MDYNRDKFLNGLKELDISLSDEQIEQFFRYYELLVEWNEKINLTAITQFDEVISKHFIDSLTLIKAVDLSKDISIIDIGTGAGFPGIPLKIAFPHLKITLLDSLQKRVKFLNLVINELNLKNIETLHGRAEDFAAPDSLREQFDICVSRAVANLSTLSEYCLPYVKVNGVFVSYKSEKLTSELEQANKAVFLLGGKVTDQITFKLFDTDNVRNLLVIGKKSPTSKKYPRKAGLPSKDPL